MSFDEFLDATDPAMFGYYKSIQKAQQLRGQFDVEPRYYSDKNSEIDFVLQNGTEIIPVEAKGGEDKSAPSFKKYVHDRHPEHAIRYSKRGYRKDGDITNLPLYLAGKTKELL